MSSKLFDGEAKWVDGMIAFWRYFRLQVYGNVDIKDRVSATVRARSAAAGI